MNDSRPHARQIREREQGEVRPQSRPIPVRGQSANRASSRQQARLQPVRSRDNDAASTGDYQASAADANSPQKSKSLALSASEASTWTGIGREPDPATNCPRYCILVAIAPPTNFPVHIRSISTNVLF